MAKLLESSGLEWTCVNTPEGPDSSEAIRDVLGCGRGGSGERLAPARSESSEVRATHRHHGGHGNPRERRHEGRNPTGTAASGQTTMRSSPVTTARGTTPSRSGA